MPGTQSSMNLQQENNAGVTSAQESEDASATESSCPINANEAEQDTQLAAASQNITEQPDLHFVVLMQRCMQQDHYPRTIVEACKTFKEKRETLHKQLLERFETCPSGITVILSLFYHMGLQLPTTQVSYEASCQSYMESIPNRRALSSISLPETLEEFLAFLRDNDTTFSRHFWAILHENAELMQSILLEALDFSCEFHPFQPHNRSDDSEDDGSGASITHLPGSSSGVLSTFV